MEKYRITYHMFPENNIEIVILAKNYDDACIFAKRYRKEAFSIVKEQG